MADMLVEIARGIGGVLSTPLAIIIVTLIILVLYARSQQSALCQNSR